MSGRLWIRWSLGSLAVASIVWGCQDPSRLTAPKQVPGSFAFDASVPPQLTGGELIICKDTPPGTSGVFEIDVFFPTGSSEYFINSGTCRTTVRSNSDPSIDVEEILSNGTPGFHLVSVT